MSVIYESRARILAVDAEVPWQELAKRFRAPKGKVVVVMHPMPDKIGEILIPEKARLKADVGTVVASDGRGVMLRGKLVFPPEPGTIVLIHPSDGSVIHVDGHTLKSVGAFLAEQEWTVQSCDWFESIVAQIKDGKIEAYGDKIVI